MAPRSILATCSPYGSISQGGIPISAAISVTGLRVARREISSALGIAISATSRSHTVIFPAGFFCAESRCRINHCLRLGECLHYVAPSHAAPAAHRSRPPAEGQVGLPQVGCGVDVDPAGPSPLRDGEAPLE